MTQKMHTVNRTDNYIVTRICRQPKLITKKTYCIAAYLAHLPASGGHANKIITVAKVRLRLECVPYVAVKFI